MLFGVGVTAAIRWKARFQMKDVAAEPMEGINAAAASGLAPKCRAGVKITVACRPARQLGREGFDDQHQRTAPLLLAPGHQP